MVSDQMGTELLSHLSDIPYSFFIISIHTVLNDKIQSTVTTVLYFIDFEIAILFF
jgi:hypothetical protein